VRLSLWGKVESTNGDFIIDDEGVPEILRTFAEHGTAVPIDVEHETLPERQPAAGSRGAIGWIEKVFAEANKGLFGFVRWSDAGKALILSDAFRYLSPVFWIRKGDRRVIGLHSAAITTLPAIPRMERLAASQNAKPESTAPADENAAIAQTVRKVLGLKDDADVDLVMASVTTLKAGTVRLKAMETELSTLKAQINSQQTERWVADYSAKGVVGIGKDDVERKADREMILRMACSSRADCEGVLQRRLAFLPPSGVTTPPTGRQMTIIESEREYRGNVGHQKATSLLAFVSNSLRERELPKLTETETAELSIV